MEHANSNKSMLSRGACAEAARAYIPGRANSAMPMTICECRLISLISDLPPPRWTKNVKF